MKPVCTRILLIITCGCLGGCARPPKEAVFEPNIVYAYATEIDIGYSMQQALAEAQAALHDFFGTPDQPRLPDFLESAAANLVSLDRLLAASGPVAEQGSGLYRQHCSTCHGITGNGRGPNAAISNPYPRDFRMGKFKFKSTARGSKPLRDDLHYTIKHGIAGTTMVPIKELSDQDIEALIDYVIYLSWRGEVERELLRIAEEIEFDSEDEEELRHLYAPGTRHFDDQQLSAVRETIADVAERWLAAADQVKPVPDPGPIPVHASLAELLAARDATHDSPLKASILRGQELFTSEAAACGKCHGAQGHGDGQTQDFDDWTKDWTTRAKLDPNNEQALIPLLARGALSPRKILPRDLREGVYRGGGEPERLYHRIAYGIDGTPMPAVEGVVAPEDIWHLVNFVRSQAEPAALTEEESGVPQSASEQPTASTVTSESL